MLSIYHQAIITNEIESDPAQFEAVQHLNGVYLDLISQTIGWRQLKPKSYFPVQGLYLWGGVGRGKTYLMDMFYYNLPFKQKARMHFHRFMYQVHCDLICLTNQRDPLKQIAKQFSKKYRVLCFDEFFVKDIADAMILGGLLQALFELGVTIVITSNLAPNNLYQNGLQRDRFLPAIDAILKYCKVWHLESNLDYRLRYLAQAEIYHYPLDEIAEQNLERYFLGLVRMDQKFSSQILRIADRDIIAKQCAEGVVWFDFDIICHSPRTTIDYIEISRIFHTVLISGVPKMMSESDDIARRFIALVDEFYERNVTLLLSAETKLENLYSGVQLKFDFERTYSRLKEMQSQTYIASPHLS